MIISFQDKKARKLTKKRVGDHILSSYRHCIAPLLTWHISISSGPFSVQNVSSKNLAPSSRRAGELRTKEKEGRDRRIRRRFDFFYAMHCNPYAIDYLSATSYHPNQRLERRCSVPWWGRTLSQKFLSTRPWFQGGGTRGQLSATSDEAGGPSYAELEAVTLFTNLHWSSVQYQRWTGSLSSSPAIPSC